MPERGLFVGQASFPQQAPAWGPNVREQSAVRLPPRSRSGGTGSSLPFKPERTSKQLNYRDRDCGSEAIFVIRLPDGYGKRTGQPAPNARTPDGQNPNSTLTTQPRRRCSGVSGAGFANRPGRRSFSPDRITPVPLTDRPKTTTRASSI